PNSSTPNAQTYSQLPTSNPQIWELEIGSWEYVWELGVGSWELLPSPVSCDLGGAADEALQKRVHPIEGVDPPAVEQRVVHVVGEHDQLVVDVVRAEELDEAGRLRERDVA